MSVKYLLALFAMLVGTAAHAQPAEAPASMAELQGLFDAGDYPATIRGVTRLTTLRNLPEGFDLVSLWKLKAESHLRLKQTPLAIDAFDNAAKSADDDRARAIADTSARLVRKASGLNYRPRAVEAGHRPEPIDVIEPASRERALQAFYADELADARANVLRAAKATQLPPIFRAIKDLAAFRNTELAATAEEVQYLALRDRLIDAATKLMNDALVTMNARVTTLSQSAQERLAGRDGTFTLRGLNPQERLELQKAMTTCEQIAATVDELHPQASDELREPLDVLRGDARTVHALAESALNRDYTGRQR